MAAGNDGANKPEDDDPFGYLYADGQAAGAQPPQGGGYGYPGPAPAQPGVPRTSYNQVRTVGERQYGQHQQQPYVPQQQAPYGQPQAQYAAPETYGGGHGGPGGPQTRQTPIPPQRGGGSGGGPNTRGILIGAVAVVAVVVIGITAAVISNSGDKDKDDKAGGGTPTTAPSQASETPSSEPSTDKTPEELPKQDAATLKLGGSAGTETVVKGAEGAGGVYVSGFNQVGASVTWKANMPSDGKYRLTVRYAIPAVDANATLTVNGTPNSNPLGLKNFVHSSDPNLEKNWQTTWAPVTLQKGENEIKISCEQGNQCNVLLDWLEVTPG
ncbi:MULTISPECIES: CBM35 domain-containing protein [Streptomyces]|uniref:Carbohydrate-binding protein n=1 Tax=Streptomyces viridochromogenes TaxID=1938 RepID=A0A0L8LAV2_STRVR|nr:MULTISPECIES: CBM35 domain-containing protein [Streptomyces]KOG35257.1 carbohydrate-binding protein [Streptomyces viridochromogenes]